MEYPISINGKKFEKMQLASSFEELENALCHEELPENGGVITVFPEEDRLYFWMKHIPHDIDVVFVNNRNRIVAQKQMKAEAPQAENESEESYEKRLRTYSSGCPARIAIDFRAGTLEKLNLKTGSKFPVNLAGNLLKF